MTNSNRCVRNAVRLALATAASTSAPLALAQTAPAEQPVPVQEVVITGSRLLQAPNDISISPVSSVTSEDIQKTGLVRVEDVLQNLPSIAAESPSGNSISSIGINTVSLRGLGSQRTLVLINGRRMQPGGAGGVSGPGGSANAADLNQIPAELIERVDVLTGGASAVYGADAVAGVVNFVMNTHYEGIKIDTAYSFNNHKNDNQAYLGFLQASGNPIPQSTLNSGQNRNASILVGMNFADGKGNATGYATYLNTSPAVGYQFDHAGCTLNGGSTPNQPLACGGSSTSGHGRFLFVGATGTNSYAVDPVSGTFRPYSRLLDSYNYGALSYFQRKAERWTAGGFLHYDASEHASFYSETMYARNTNQAQYGPSGAFAFTGFTTSCANPLLTAQERSVLCTPANLAANQAAFGLPPNPDPATGQFTMYLGRRNVEGGGRQDNYTSNSIRQLLGVKGQINDAWNYDSYAQLGITELGDIEGNFLGVQQINNALNVVAGPGGAPTCQSVINGSDTTCVPWNIWQKGGVTPAALNYMTVPASYLATSTEYILDGSATGDLGKYGVKLPSADRGLNVNVGAEYRSENYDFKPDYIFANGFQAGGAPARAINGGYRVWEAFTEMRFPFINDKPGAYLLSMDAGYRYSSYTINNVTTNTYKLGLEYAPIQSVRLRSSYNRAVRAANLDELFEPPVVGSGGTADPCWGPVPTLSLAQCQRTGVTAAEYGNILANPAAQINTQVGGNIGLIPETADTYTFGLVFQPAAIPSLGVSVDAFNVKIKQAIISLSSNTVINNCATSGDPASCGLIHRGANGSLWFNSNEFVNTQFQNIGVLSTKGADLAGHYNFNMASLGKLSFNLVGTYTRDFLLKPLPTLNAYDCVGYFGTTCGPPLPNWRHMLNTTWGTPWSGLDVTVRWRYIGSSKTDRSSPDPQLNLVPPGSPLLFYPQTARIAAYNYIDLAASIPIGRSVDVRFGVNNIADKNPPLILNGSFSDCPNNSCNDNTWVGTYDALGRFLYAHMSVKF